MASSALATRVSRAFPGPRRKPRASAYGARASRAALASDDERVADDVVVTKRALLSAVSDSRRPGADPRACKAAILEACRALESRGAMGGDIPFADVSGRWSLVYSTNDPNGVAGTFTSPLAGVLDEDAFQRVSDQLYKAFFAFAPALAGSAETNAKGVSNTQVVDLKNGSVDNVVDARASVAAGRGSRRRARRNRGARRRRARSRGDLHRVGDWTQTAERRNRLWRLETESNADDSDAPPAPATAERRA